MTRAQLTNTVRIESQIDADSIINPINYTKARTVIIQTPGAYNVWKAVDTPLMPVNDMHTWDLSYGNTATFKLGCRISESNNYQQCDGTVVGTEQQVPIQLIDVLPFNGDGRNPATDFVGTETFNQITQTVAGKETFEFSNTAPAQISPDPCDVSNWPDLATPTLDSTCPAGLRVNSVLDTSATGTGTTTWCPVTDSDLDGKITLAEVQASCPTIVSPTAFRATTTKILNPGGLRQHMKLTLEMNGNEGDNPDTGVNEQDQYTNMFGSAVPEISLGVLSNDVVSKVFAGRIGNVVWRDLNGNGVQDADEFGIPNLTIQLTDSLGNITTTTTDSQGMYSFNNLRPGDYSVTVTTPPAGLTQTYDLDGVSTQNTTQITLLETLNSGNLLDFSGAQVTYPDGTLVPNYSGMESRYIATDDTNSATREDADFGYMVPSVGLVKKVTRY